MDDRCYIEYPSRQEDGEELGEPKHQSRKSDGEHPPEDSKKVELLPVGPTVKLRFRPFVKEPLGHPHDIPDIFPPRAERIRAKKLLQWIGISMNLLEEEKVEDVGNGGPEVSKGNNRADAVDQTRQLSSAQKVHQTTRPGRVREFQWKACQDETKEGNHHRSV